MEQPETHLLSDSAGILAQYARSTRLCRSLTFVLQLLLACAGVAAGILASLAPWLRRPISYASHLFQQAVETVVFFGSMLLLSGRLLMLRKSLPTNCRMAVTMVATYFLTPTISLVIEWSKMNYRITRMLRQASMKAGYYLQMLLVLPLSFKQMVDLSTTLFDTFLAIFKLFYNVMDVSFSYVILIFRAYKTFVLCTASIMRCVYLTSYYSIYIVHNGLGFLNAFTSLMQNSAVRRALISFKEHKRRAARTSAK